MYLFCDFGKFPFLKDRLECTGWKVFRTPLIWYKPGAYRTPWVLRGPRRTYECILFAIKGERNVNLLGDDVLEFPSDENQGHNAQKPVALFQELLARSARPGDRVLDLFCGTGPIFPAAHALKCAATGIELDLAFAGIAAQRIKELS